MRLYKEKFTQSGLSSNINFYTALEAFTNMGFHVIEVNHIEEIPTNDAE